MPVADPSGGEVRYVGEIANNADALAKLVRQLRKGEACLSFCYEAGPCGYGRHRQLTDMGLGLPSDSPLADSEEGGRPRHDRQAQQRRAGTAAPGRGSSRPRGCPTTRRRHSAMPRERVKTLNTCRLRPSNAAGPPAPARQTLSGQGRLDPAVPPLVWVP